MTIAAGNGTALWYITRASGVVSLLLLTAGLVLGIVGTVRWRSERWPRFAIVSIHRNLTLFAIAFVALHVLTTIADGYAPVGFKDAVIPFVSKYRPFALVHGLGNGSDARFGWLVIVTILCAGAVGGALALRLVRSPGRLPFR